MKKLLMMLALMLSMTASAQNADELYEEGKALYDAKDYAAALVKLRPAAEKGHKKAQYRMGRCYDKGHGVEENNAEAFKWYSKSAAFASWACLREFSCCLLMYLRPIFHSLMSPQMNTM